MKKHVTRALALLLAVLMVFTICGCKKGEDKNKTKYDPLPGETPVDLDGYEFTVIDVNNGRWNKELSGTPHTDAWLQIMDEVEYLYNCTLTATQSTAQEIFNVVQPEIMAGGKAANIIVTTQWSMGQFVGANLLADLNTLDVNWDNEWWNQNIRNISTLGGKTYVGNGSFIFDTAQTWILYYNEAIWDECGFPDPYELVDNGQWTFDRFREYCRIAAKDLDGTGVLDSSQDRWGLTAPDGDFADALYFALGGHYFAPNENGKVDLVCNTDRTFTIVEAMCNFVKQDKTMDTTKYDPWQERFNTFTAGNALFLGYVPGVAVLTDMEDDWGALPLPKFDASQEDYYSSVDHNSSVFAVTNTNDELYETAVVLEALGRHAMILEDIYWPDYKDIYWRHPEDDARMLDEYVVGHGQYDMALLMARCNDAFSAPRTQVYRLMFQSAGSDYSSYIDMVEDAIESTITDYFESR